MKRKKLTIDDLKAQLTALGFHFDSDGRQMGSTSIDPDLLQIPEINLSESHAQLLALIEASNPALEQYLADISIK